MSKILAIARSTFVANIRNRIFLVLALFGALLLAASVLLGVLGQEQERRMLVDLGLAAIEALAFLTAVFLIVNIILEEIESKTLYLVLTRSVSRLQYLAGRYLGTVLSVLACVGLMTAAHVAILLFKGWDFRAEGLQYAAAVVLSFEKILLISAIGLFFSLFSSSAVVAMVFTLFFWVLGHFALELKFLAGAMKSEAPKRLLQAVYHLIPHFQYMNARDLWIAAPGRVPEFFLQGTLYALVYSALVFALAWTTFRKKEF